MQKEFLIIVHGKANISPYDSLKEFFIQELSKLFFLHFAKDFPLTIECTTSMFVKSNHLRLLLKLNTHWLEFNTLSIWDGEENIRFIPHENSDTNIFRLCQALNEIVALVEQVDILGQMIQKLKAQAQTQTQEKTYEINQ